MRRFRDLAAAEPLPIGWLIGVLVRIPGEAAPVRITAAERDLAVRAVRALGLQVAGVDILRAADGPKVIEVNSSPGLQGVERASGKDVAGRIIEHLEQKLRPRAALNATQAQRGSA